MDDALQQLIYRLIPSDPDEDEGEEDERFDEALNIARDIIGRHDPFPTPCGRHGQMYNV